MKIYRLTLNTNTCFVIKTFLFLVLPVAKTVCCTKTPRAVLSSKFNRRKNYIY